MEGDSPSYRNDRRFAGEITGRYGRSNDSAEGLPVPAG